MSAKDTSNKPYASLDITTKGKPWKDHKTLRPLLEKTFYVTLKNAFQNEYLSPEFIILKEHPLEISLLLAHNPFIQKLNKKWLNKNMPTNVLSFPSYEKQEFLHFKNLPLPPEKIFLGDIVLSYEYCLEESQKQGKPFTNHIQHLFAHGILHLLGFDHLTDQEANIMESLEITILANLMISNPYLYPI